MPKKFNCLFVLLTYLCIHDINTPRGRELRGLCLTCPEVIVSHCLKRENGSLLTVVFFVY